MSFYIMILFVFFLLKNIYYVVLSVNFNFFSNSFVVLIIIIYLLTLDSVGCFIGERGHVALENSKLTCLDY